MDELLHTMEWLDTDSGQWIVEGVELDYAASGHSIEQARTHFWHGLCQTFYINQKRFGHCYHVMRAPASAGTNGT